MRDERGARVARRFDVAFTEVTKRCVELGERVRELNMPVKAKVDIGTASVTYEDGRSGWAIYVHDEHGTHLAHEAPVHLRAAVMLVGDQLIEQLIRAGDEVAEALEAAIKGTDQPREEKP